MGEIVEVMYPEMLPPGNKTRRWHVQSSVSGTLLLQFPTGTDQSNNGLERHWLTYARSVLDTSEGMQAHLEDPLTIKLKKWQKALGSVDS